MFTFEIEKFGSHRVSFEKDYLSLTIDIWGNADGLFSAQFGAECYYLWKTYQAKPTGEPERSRMNTSFGIGETPEQPTVIKAEFVCLADLEDYEAQIRKALEKEDSYESYKRLRKEAEKQEKEEKKLREKALNKK